MVSSIARPQQSRSGVGVIKRAPLRLRLESVEVQHPLETLDREFNQQLATPRRAAVDPWRQNRPILFQLPPDFAADAGRLTSFPTLLPERRHYSFEFRHPSWYAPRILRVLADRNIALCISDHHEAPAPWERTADFVYLRGHGPQGRYQGRYSRARLAAWRNSIRA
jgi:uncharacterized protein YecE (DUF72 family)